MNAARRRCPHPTRPRCAAGSTVPAVRLSGFAAPVAQGIEHRPPEAVAQVRILPGAPSKSGAVASSPRRSRSLVVHDSWDHVADRLIPCHPRQRPRGHIEELPSGQLPCHRLRRLRSADEASGGTSARPRRRYADAELALTQAAKPGRREPPPEDRDHPRPGDRPLARDRPARRHDPRRYEDLIRIYIKPTLGDLVAGKLDAELLESFYARLQRCRDSAATAAAGGPRHAGR